MQNGKRVVDFFSLLLPHVYRHDEARGSTGKTSAHLSDIGYSNVSGLLRGLTFELSLSLYLVVCSENVRRTGGEHCTFRLVITSTTKNGRIEGGVPR